MTLYRATFNIYEDPRNDHFDDNNVVEGMEIRSIVVKQIDKCNINQIRIKDVLYVSKLHVNLSSLSKLVSNYLKIQFNLMNALFNLATVKPLRLDHAKTICIKVIFCGCVRSGCD